MTERHLPNDRMYYAPDAGNPNLTSWHEFKTENIINTELPTSQESSVSIVANKTCYIPGGCVMFNLKEKIGNVFINRMHRGFIGMIPFDNTQAKFCALVGYGGQNYPDPSKLASNGSIVYDESNPYGTIEYPEDITENLSRNVIYNIYHIAYMNKKVDDTWQHDIDISYETSLEDPDETDITKVWDVEEYSGDDTTLFTTMKKCLIYNQNPLLDCETTVCPYLVRIPSGGDSEKDLLYDPNYDYRTIYGQKLLQFVRSEPFMATPYIMGPLVKDGASAFALNYWRITGYAYQTFYWGTPFTPITQNPSIIVLNFSDELSGMSLDDDAESISVTMHLYGFGDKTIEIPLNSTTVPPEPDRYDERYLTINAYAQEEAYFGKLYYMGIDRRKLFIDFVLFGYPSSTGSWTAFKNINTYVTAHQNNPDHDIEITSWEPYSKSATRTESINRSMIMVYVNTTYRLNTDGTFPDLDEEAIIFEFYVIGKPFSIINNDLTVTAVASYRDAAGTEKVLDFNYFLTETLHRTVVLPGMPHPLAVNVVTVAIPRLYVPNKSSYFTPGPYCIGYDPSWGIYHLLWQSHNNIRATFSEGSQVDIPIGRTGFNVFLFGTDWWGHSNKGNKYFSMITSTNKFRYDPAQHIDIATLTNYLAFHSNNYINSFNGDSTYEIQGNCGTYFYKVNNTAFMLQTDTPEIYTLGGIVYFNTSTWVSSPLPGGEEGHSLLVREYEEPIPDNWVKGTGYLLEHLEGTTRMLYSFPLLFFYVE